MNPQDLALLRGLFHRFTPAQIAALAAEPPAPAAAGAAAAAVPPAAAAAAEAAAENEPALQGNPYVPVPGNENANAQVAAANGNVNAQVEQAAGAAVANVGVNVQAAQPANGNVNAQVGQAAGAAAANGNVNVQGAQPAGAAVANVNAIDLAAARIIGAVNAGANANAAPEEPRLDVLGNPVPPEPVYQQNFWVEEYKTFLSQAQFDEARRLGVLHTCPLVQVGWARRVLRRNAISSSSLQLITRNDRQDCGRLAQELANDANRMNGLPEYGRYKHYKCYVVLLVWACFRARDSDVE